MCSRSSSPPRAPLPALSVGALFSASIGLKVRNSSYQANLADGFGPISTQTATTDLAEVVRSGLMVQNGSKRGTYYAASAHLQELASATRGKRLPLTASELFVVSEPQLFETSS